MGNLTDFFAASVGGGVLEQISGICDGRTVTTSRGSYTLANVSSQQTLTNTHTTITGSTIDYTPPTGTTHVRYEFDYKRNYKDLYQLYHLGFHIGGTEATIFRHSTYAYEDGNNRDIEGERFTAVINIEGSSDDIANGKLASWTSDKTLELKGRNYGTSYETYLHGLVYWDGTNASGITLERPRLTITAIG